MKPPHRVPCSEPASSSTPRQPSPSPNASIHSSRPFFEDPLGVTYNESWLALKRVCRTPLLVGEKLKLVAGFKPFLETQTADILHPDLVYAGGLTGCKRIANFAANYTT